MWTAGHLYLERFSKGRPREGRVRPTLEAGSRASMQSHISSRSRPGSWRSQVSRVRCPAACAPPARRPQVHAGHGTFGATLTGFKRKRESRKTANINHR